MITKLTEQQERGIQEWQQHCLKIGRDISPINKEVTESSWKKFYKILDKGEPSFWYCQSPLQAQIIINIFPEIQKISNVKNGANIKNNIWDNIGASIWTNIKDNIGDNIWASIWTNIKDNIRANIWNNIGANIRDNIGASIWTNIKDNIRANIWNNIGANIRDNIGASIWTNIKDNIGANIKNLDFEYKETYSWCQHDINWIAYYKYFAKYGLLPHDKNFEISDIWYDLACSCGWCYTFVNMVFVCEKPFKIFFNARNQLHKDGSMALEYSDGYGLYMLNGIKMHKEIVMTPAEKIDPVLALVEKNADVQREIIRKIGAERMLKSCAAKTLDTWNDPKTGYNYKLMDMTIGQNIRRKYMYYEHASIPGVFFAKPVPPEVTKAMHGFCWQRKLVSREKLNNISSADEAELLANLPSVVC